MARLPIVSIVGRPNVGKSSLFNRIVGRRLAVVDDQPGVTRDRHYSEAQWLNTKFMLVDTGGMVPESREVMASLVNEQVEAAIQESSAIIFLTEALPGPTDIDLVVARMLRQRCPEKVILAVNKSESPSAEMEVPMHIQLGLGDPLAVSAIHGYGVGDMLEAIINVLKAADEHQEFHREDDLAIAIIGRPNAGKSSLVNTLLRQDRMIVDSVAGTTRDAIDSYFHYDEKTIRIIDTAGLRKKAQVNENVEYYSNLRALDSVDRADVCVLMVDTANRLGEQDFKILTQINKQRKGVILCFNKWDAIEKDIKTFDKLVKDTRHNFMETKHIPILSVSALTGQRVTTIIDAAIAIKEKMTRRLPPAELSDTFFSWIKHSPHPYIPVHPVRFLGIKQKQGKDHPHFTLFCVNPESVLPAYRRFLLHKFHETWDFLGCPIVFEFQTMGRSTKKRHYGAGEGEGSSNNEESDE